MSAQCSKLLKVTRVELLDDRILLSLSLSQRLHDRHLLIAAAFDATNSTMTRYKRHRYHFKKCEIISLRDA